MALFAQSLVSYSNFQLTQAFIIPNGNAQENFKPLPPIPTENQIEDPSFPTFTLMKRQLYSLLRVPDGNKTVDLEFQDYERRFNQVRGSALKYMDEEKRLIKHFEEFVHAIVHLDNDLDTLHDKLLKANIQPPFHVATLEFMRANTAFSKEGKQKMHSMEILDFLDSLRKVEVAIARRKRAYEALSAARSGELPNYQPEEMESTCEQFNQMAKQEIRLVLDKKTDIFKKVVKALLYELNCCWERWASAASQLTTALSQSVPAEPPSWENTTEYVISTTVLNSQETPEGNQAKSIVKKLPPIPVMTSDSIPHDSSTPIVKSMKKKIRETTQRLREKIGMADKTSDPEFVTLSNSYFNAQTMTERACKQVKTIGTYCRVVMETVAELARSLEKVFEIDLLSSSDQVSLMKALTKGLEEVGREVNIGIERDCYYKLNREITDLQQVHSLLKQFGSTRVQFDYWKRNYEENKNSTNLHNLQIWQKNYVELLKASKARMKHMQRSHDYVVRCVFRDLSQHLQSIASGGTEVIANLSDIAASSQFDSTEQKTDDVSTLNQKFPLWIANQMKDFSKIPKLVVQILLIGSRGDIQPFVIFARELAKYGHRVRFGTHGTYREWIEKEGFEFASIGGDPKQLMAFMVEHPSMITLDMDVIKKQKETMAEIFEGSWKACIETVFPDVIISNPPVGSHIHIAEKLGIPLQIWFTMPWSTTKHYRHPLANMVPSFCSNRSSYQIMDNLLWTGMRGILNDFRDKSLKLPAAYGAHMLEQLRIPHVYGFSPSLVPRPSDWQNHIEITGFLFENTPEGSYSPPDDLQQFLLAGPPPIYIGFGSIVVKDPTAMTNMIFRALHKTGIRAIVSKGWSGIGGGQSNEEAIEKPPNAYLIGHCPHDWLFPRCAAVVHHGGAGTTAIGLRSGRPTQIIPFFGDQPFWGNLVFEMRVGPPPVPFSELTTEKLISSLEFLLTKDVRQRAELMATKLLSENSEQASVNAFYKYLPFDDQGRVVCVTFENQRHLPLIGWTSKNLTPTDPHTWSDSKGILSLPKEAFRCPAGWEWQGEWEIVRNSRASQGSSSALSQSCPQVIAPTPIRPDSPPPQTALLTYHSQSNILGPSFVPFSDVIEPSYETDPQGWRYAFGFESSYSAWRTSQSSVTQVRQRMWIRRKYKKL